MAKKTVNVRMSPKETQRFFEEKISSNRSKRMAYQKLSRMLSIAPDANTALKRLSEPKVRETVLKYKPELQAEVAHEFASAAVSGKSLNGLVKTLSDGELVSGINSFDASYGDVAPHVINIIKNGFGKGEPARVIGMLKEYGNLVNDLYPPEEGRELLESIASNIQNYSHFLPKEHTADAIRNMSNEAVKETFKKYGRAFIRNVLEFVPGDLARGVAFGVTYTWSDKKRHKTRGVREDELRKMSQKLLSDEIYGKVRSLPEEGQKVLRGLLCESAHREFALGKDGAVDKTLRMTEGLGQDYVNESEYRALSYAIGKDLQDVAGAGPEGLKAMKMYMILEEKLPIPTVGNIDEYERIVEERIESFGLPKELDPEFRIGIIKNKDAKSIRKLVDLSEVSVEERVRSYSVKSKGTTDVNYEKYDLIKNSVIAVVGSRDPSKDSESYEMFSSLVGSDAVKKARHDFRKGHKRLLPNVVDAYSNMDYNLAREILAATNEESVEDVLAAANYRDVDVKDPNFVRAYETRDPLRFDNGLQGCCVYLPASQEDDKDIVKYCTDPKFTMVMYEVGGARIGSAICYEDGGNFLVDSVEGHRRFRKDGIFDAVYNDLVWRAGEKGADKLVFGTGMGLMNLTPKMFLEYIDGKGVGKSIIFKPGSEAHGAPDRNGLVFMDLRTKGYIETKYNRPVYMVKL